MKYNCKPIYKYLMILFLISLFIFHQKTTMDALKILILSTILTLFFLIMDFAFIQDHPNLMKDNIIKKITTKSQQNEVILQKNQTVNFSKKSNYKLRNNRNEEYDIDYDQNHTNRQNETCSSCNNGHQYNMYDDNIKNSSNKEYKRDLNHVNDPKYMTSSSLHLNQPHYLEYN
jgi:hypothetical protein